MTDVVEWLFEAAEPEVGFLSDTVTHACEANEDAEPALIVDTHLWSLPCGKIVNEQTVFECPVCKATTSTVDSWPRWMFEPEN